MWLAPSLDSHAFGIYIYIGKVYKRAAVHMPVSMLSGARQDEQGFLSTKNHAGKWIIPHKALFTYLSSE